MKSDQLLIFDLDDTIFKTKSIEQHHVASILDNFRMNTKQFYSRKEIDLIVSDLWKFPFDHVSHKYQFDELLCEQFSNSVNNLEYQLDIQTFDDFKHVKDIRANKVLVTTGFKKLQLAKIAALDIEQEFDEIYIDEVYDPGRIHKKGIFEKILDSTKRESRNHFVIGDNPNSELKAGYELGLTTIQVAKFGQLQSKFSNYLISNFESLPEIINKHEHNNSYE